MQFADNYGAISTKQDLKMKYKPLKKRQAPKCKPIQSYKKDNLPNCSRKMHTIDDDDCEAQLVPIELDGSCDETTSLIPCVLLMIPTPFSVALRDSENQITQFGWETFTLSIES